MEKYALKNQKPLRMPIIPRLFLSLIVIMLTTVILSILISAFIKPNPLNQIAKFSFNGATTAVGLICGVYFSRYLIDKRDFASLGLAINLQALKDYIIGFLLCLALLVAFYGLQFLLGNLEYAWFAWGAETGQSFSFLITHFFAWALLSGISTELLFRGIIYQNIEEQYGGKKAIFVSILIYIVIFLLPPLIIAESLEFILAGLFSLIFSIVRILAYTRTRSLWLAIGISSCWTFSKVFTGFKLTDTFTINMIKLIPHQPNWISGYGDYGVEGSLLMLPILLLIAAAILMWTEERDLS